MKLVHKMIDQIEEELEGAMGYAEKFIESKVHGDTHRANIYRQMSFDELTHAGNVYEFSAADMARIKSVHQLSEECELRWEEAKKHYAEFVAKVKYLLN